MVEEVVGRAGEMPLWVCEDKEPAASHAGLDLDRGWGRGTDDSRFLASAMGGQWQRHQLRG